MALGSAKGLQSQKDSGSSSAPSSTSSWLPPSQGLSLFILKVEVGTSLVIQRLKPLAPNAGHAGSIPGQGTIPHVPTKSLHAPTKDPTCCNKHKDQVQENK